MALESRETMPELFTGASTSRLFGPPICPTLLPTLVRFADQASLVLEYLYRRLWQGRSEAKWFAEEEQNTIFT